MPLVNLYAFGHPRYDNRSSIILNVPAALKVLSHSSECLRLPRQFRACLLHRLTARVEAAKPFPRPLFALQEIFPSETCVCLWLASRSGVCGTRRCETHPTGAGADSLPGAECLPRSALR